MVKYRKLYEAERNDKKDIERAYKKQIIREIHHTLPEEGPPYFNVPLDQQATFSGQQNSMSELPLYQGENSRNLN